MKKANIKKQKMASSFATFLVTTSLMLLIMAKIGEGGSVGINFGRQASQKLLPSMVVDMCLANGITKVKLFSTNEGVMSAFSGTDIELIVAIPNIELREKLIEQKSREWVKQYISNYRENQKVNIRYLCVGVEPFSMIDRVDDDTSYTWFIGKVMGNMQTIIEGDENLKGKVKLGVPMGTNLLERVSKPSESDFNKDFKPRILEVLKILDETGSPFMLNIYPYYILSNEKLPVEFGMFDKRSNYTVKDGDLVYTNAFDVRYDGAVWALRKNGYGHLKILVTQVGWPTDGGPGATVANAKRFYEGLLKKVASKEGTPLLPGTDMDVYLYVLSDENQRRLDRGSFERHYGIYDADGKPKFSIDFTLQGRDIELESAQGVSYLPRRWCVLDEEKAASPTANKTLLKWVFDNACDNGDCTALAEGGSCSSLPYYKQVSYAFNNYFQIQNQEVTGDAACRYEEFGKIVNENPSTQGCDFPLQILSTLFLGNLSNSEMNFTLGKESDFAGESLRLSFPLIILKLILWMAGIWL